MVTDSRQQFEKQLAALAEKFSQRKDEYMRTDRTSFIDLPPRHR
jgi:hypothetical protein